MVDLRAFLALVGFAFAALGSGCALEFQRHSIDDAGAWGLALVGLVVCGVAAFSRRADWRVLRSRVTPLAVWEAMAAGDDLDVIRRDLPEEFWSDFDAIRGRLVAAHASLVSAVDADVARRAAQSDKEVGLDIASLSPAVRPFLFTARCLGAAWHEQPKARAAIFRQFRPTGNVLAGYAASAQVARVQEAS